MAFLSGWSKYIELTIAAADIDAALTGFAIPVKISTASGKFDKDVSAVFDEIGANWKRVAFQVGESLLECYAEKELWDTGTENGLFWVKADLADSDNVIRMYFDNSHADNDTYIGEVTSTAAQSVWASEIKNRYGLAQDPTGGTGAIKDSTINARHGTSAGTMTSGDLVNTVIGKGLDFDGLDDKISIPNCAEIELANIDTTISAFIKVTGANTGNTWRGIFSQGDTAYQGYFLRLGTSVSSSSLNLFHFYGNGSAWKETTGSLIPLNTGYHVAAVYEIGGTLKLYINGVLDQTSSFASARVSDTDSVARIGEGWPSGGRFFKGIISEVRVEHTARSAAWLLALTKGLNDNLLTFSDVKYIPFESENVLKNNILLYFTSEIYLNNNILTYFTPEFALKNSLIMDKEGFLKNSLIFDSEKSIINNILGKFYAEFVFKNSFIMEKERFFKNSLIMEKENILKFSLIIENDKIFKNSLIFDSDFILKNRIFLANELFFKHSFEILSEKILKNNLESIGYKEIYLKNSILESVISEFILKNHILSIAYIDKEIILLNRLRTAPGDAGSGLVFGNFYFDTEHGI